MLYKTISLPLSQIIIRRNAVVEPLCNVCQTKDCENIIEKKEISIYGVNKKWNLLARSGSYESVVSCEGFLISNTKEKEK